MPGPSPASTRRGCDVTRALPLVLDRRKRPLTDLRISVTDRCNFRCRYCMPREVFGPDHAFLERGELLSFEEITRVAAAFAKAGVTGLRLTGGEPLLRRGLPDLVAMLREVPGIEQVAITTNGVLLPKHAKDLAAAGLTRVTVSLDAMDDAIHRAVADVEVPVASVLAGVDAAVEHGLGPVKINAVLRRGVNENQVEPLAAYGRERGVTMRFIEFMDVGTTNHWQLDEVVPSAEVIALINEQWPLEAVPARHPGEVATRFRYLDGSGEVGVISSVSAPFCADCSRARLSSIGEVFTCLFGTEGTDLRGPLRDGMSDDALATTINDIWHQRTDRYSELRAATNTDEGPDGRVEMSYIGG
ncbi:MAG: cyclic pyranopterin phosphate synthase [Glaciecola sp.]|jgi:cyclic pyranopterin phosphate synthase